MRTLVLALALSTTVLGAACAFLLWRDHDQRAGTSETDEGTTEARIEALVAERERLRREVEQGRTEAPCDEPGTRRTIAARLEAAAGSAALNGPMRGHLLRGSFIERLSPEHRRTMTRQRYGMLFPELSLSNAEIEALLPILASHDELTRLDVASSTTADPSETAARDVAIAGVLGAPKAAQFAELLRSMPARMEARLLSTHLEHAGEPLTKEQEQQLTAAMKATGSFAPLPDLSAASREESRQRFQTWRAERAKAIHALAAPVLTPVQLQRLEENEALQVALQAAMPPLSPTPVD